MQIVELDVMDGKPIKVVVESHVDALRLAKFMEHATSAIGSQIDEESEWYAELNRGYAKDRI